MFPPSRRFASDPSADLADKSLSPQHPKAVRRAADDRTTSSDDAQSEPPREIVQGSSGLDAADADASAVPASKLPPIVQPIRDEVAQSTQPVPIAAPEPSLSLDEEIEAALGGMSIEQLMQVSDESSSAELKPDSRIQALVTRVHGDDVFLILKGRFEGVASLSRIRQASPSWTGARHRRQTVQRRGGSLRSLRAGCVDRRRRLERFGSGCAGRSRA